MKSLPRLYNLHKKFDTVPSSAVYIGRPSVWGNPFTMKFESERDKVVDKFQEYANNKLKQEPDWLLPLVGRDLACYCYPKRCHGDVLLQSVERIYGKQAKETQETERTKDYKETDSR